MSMFREAPLPDGTKGPVSIRRVAAAWCAMIFGVAVVGVIKNLPLILSLGASAIGVVAVLIGFPLLGLLLLLFFTTWEAIQGVIAAVQKKE